MTDHFIWISLGIIAAIVSSGIPLVQEKHKGNPFAVAIWVKIGVALLTLPFVMYLGLPDNPRFYIFAGLSAAIWSISDVIYYRSVSEVGAGVVSRVLPSAAILSFLVWFVINPDQLQKYLDNPVQGGLIFLIIIAASLLAMLMKKCPVSWRGLQLVWFVLLAAAIGPLVEKISMGDEPSIKAPFAMTFIQAVMMLGFWAIFAAVKRPITFKTFTLPTSWKTGLMISTFMTVVLCSRFAALQYVEHPAFLSVILFTDSLWILLYYRLIGRNDGSKIWAGLGIVGCAAALVLVKSF
jgi:hypothetical protein